jgi:hypothetical protein
LARIATERKGQLAWYCLRFRLIKISALSIHA